MHAYENSFFFFFALQKCKQPLNNILALEYNLFKMLFFFNTQTEHCEYW